MWNTLARNAAKGIGGYANMIGSASETNRPEVYADRIKRDFHLDDYADAWALYDADRPYWENYYRAQSKGPANQEFVRDSAAAAGVPSQNNVFEYGFPESPVRPPEGEVPPLRTPNQPAWNNAFVRDSANAAGMALPGQSASVSVVAASKRQRAEAFRERNMPRRARQVAQRNREHRRAVSIIFRDKSYSSRVRKSSAEHCCKKDFAEQIWTARGVPSKSDVDLESKILRGSDQDKDHL